VVQISHRYGMILFIALRGDVLCRLVSWAFFKRPALFPG